jgi:predicted SprT family Zn-dependent metalloprotease
MASDVEYQDHTYFCGYCKTTFSKKIRYKLDARTQIPVMTTVNVICPSCNNTLKRKEDMI